MKNIFITVLILLLFMGSLFSQNSNDIYKYANGIYDFWDAGKIDSAVAYSVKLAELKPGMFEDNVHTVLAPCIVSGKKYGNAAKYLKKLYKENNPQINKIVAPLYTLNAIMETGNRDSVLSLADSFFSLLADTCNYSSKAESYGLILLKQLETQNIKNDIFKERLLKKIISNIQHSTNIDSIFVSGKQDKEKRAWSRFVLSNSYFLLYKLNPNDVKAEDFLKLAAKYCPDLEDKLVDYAYFYDASALGGDVKNTGFEWLYIDYLKQKNRNEEALSIAAKKTVTEPTDTNLSRLRELYDQSGVKEPFARYWLAAINNVSKVSPTISTKFIDGTVINFGKPAGKWVYIDVWGSWCGPCRKELPELEKLYIDNLAKAGSGLIIYTFSFNSENLTDFLKTNKYTFPVAEIDKEVVKAFNIQGYPTKILITPQGKYLQIPFGADWRQYLKNYCLNK